jgi:hypothetical protein
MKKKMIAFLLILMVVGCSKSPIVGKVVITEQEFSIQKDGTVWIVNAKGKVKNIGSVPVKNIMITGFCRSCDEVLTAGVWYKSVYEKEPHQIGSVNYLPAGAEEKFNFKEIAYFFNQDGSKPSNMPEKLELEIVSFQSIQK